MRIDAMERRVRWKQAGLVFGIALALRLVYAAITRGTYDFDEFVYLLLGRAMADGRLPYRDFLFYHPPATLALVALLNPLVSHWWVWMRIVTMAIDAGTCTLVYLITSRFWMLHVAFVAALLCASSPLMLTTGTRVMPDVYVAFCGTLAIYCLLRARDVRWSILAGVAFGLSVVFKYPAGLLLPACLILAWRRPRGVLAFLGAAGLTVTAVFLPLLPEWHAVLTDTVFFQTGRGSEPLTTRLGSLILFAILLQPLAVFGLFVRPYRAWLLVAYLAVFAYLLAPQVYYHYLSPIVPFGSILGGVYLGRIRGLTPRFLMRTASAGAVALTLLWSAIIAAGGTGPLHITVASLAYEQSIEQYISSSVPLHGLLLQDRPEGVYLTDRRNLDEYFWNDAAVMSPQQLQQGLLRLRYVILTFGPATGYPPGFSNWIDARYCRKLLSAGFAYDLHCVNRTYVPPRG